jgi:signal transduction protein with GAF and PtsI domain
MLQPSIIAPLLDSILSRTEAAGVYLYAFHPTRAAELVAWAGAAPRTDISPMTGIAITEHLDRESPIVIHDDAWADPRFRNFPEFLKHEFRGLISAPLIHSGRSVGLLNVCRTDPATLKAGEVALLFGLSLPMAALLAVGAENSSLREQVETLTRDLADRKVLDRAKGILQARFSWTEEEAYLHLRRTSRRRRTPMREIAMEVIAKAAPNFLQARAS